MSFLLDTNVAIYLRDGDAETRRRVGHLEGAILFSVVTRVELEGGVRAVPDEAAARRARLSALLDSISVVAFDDEAADAYRQIVEVTGYSRRKILDRMIAATALTNDLTLVTLNPDDFRDVPGLKLLAW